MNECPICGRTWTKAESLVEHVWMYHIMGVVCWCGMRFHVCEHWHEHIKAEGGFLAHYLACQLGGQGIHGWNE